MTRVTLIDETLSDAYTDERGIEHEAGARIVPALAEFGLPIRVSKGETIDVPAELAGVRPYYRKMTPDELADQQHRHHVAAPDGVHDPEQTTMHDLGRGLLAQITVWAPADDETPED